MLSLSELKYYNKYTDADKDIFFQSCIDMATGNIGSKCQRSFAYANHIEYFNVDSRGYYNWNCEQYFPYYNNPILSLNPPKQRIFLSNLPVQNVTAIEMLNTDGTYSTIFTESDTIANSTILNKDTGELSLINGYSFPYGSNSTRITYNAGYRFSQLTGTVSNDANTKIITGIGTLFTAELNIGDYILIGNERKTISAISSATSLTVSFNFIEAHSGNVSYVNNFPDDLRKFCFELSTWIYFQSPQSDLKYLGLSGINQGGQSSIGKSISEPKWEDIIKNYQIWNI